MDTCAICGHPTDTHDRHIRFRLPEPLRANPEPLDDPRTWLSHEDADRSVLMQVPDMGAFVRALLQIRLTGGYQLTYGLWVAIRPNDLQQAFSVWWEPEYTGLRLSGLLANPVPPWGLLFAPVELAVRDPEHTPYCERSPDPKLDAVLRREWEHSTVLDAAKMT